MEEAASQLYNKLGLHKGISLDKFEPPRRNDMSLEDLIKRREAIHLQS
jgi:hypothetical protein